MAEKIISIDAEKIPAVFGSLDHNLSLIESRFSVKIFAGGDQVRISSDVIDNVEKAASAFSKLAEAVTLNLEIDEQVLDYVLMSTEEKEECFNFPTDRDVICTTHLGKPIKPKTDGQKKYCTAISKNTITFGVGPAGTGKTYLAVAAAVKSFKSREISRIILTRPAVEAGEKLGFLPGDLQNKIDPYLRPLFDALLECFGAETLQKNMEKSLIEVAPLAYMRGRTLENAFIILDEAQNATREQMKMFLTRLGAGSKMIVTGDLTQTDLPDVKKSGLYEATKILKNIERIEICYFTEKDVVRHRLVREIIKAYSKSEAL